MLQNILSYLAPVLSILIALAFVKLTISQLGSSLSRNKAAQSHIKSTAWMWFRPGGLTAATTLSRLGENALPKTSLSTILMRTTPGVRIVSVVLTSALNFLLWYPAPGQWIPEGPMTIGITAASLIACFGLFNYEARVEYERLIISKWGLLRREYLWRDLTGIKDDGHYEYILSFGKTTVRMPKHLVGIHGFLTFVGETLTGNQARNARTSRS